MPHSCPSPPPAPPGGPPATPPRPSSVEAPPGAAAPPHRARPRLIKSGAGAVTAAALAESADVEIVNPQLGLMTLDTDDVTIEMDLTVERGVGYLGAERA